MIVRSRMVLAGALLVTGACAGADGGDWAGSVTDSAGIAIVDNPSTGVWTSATQPTVTEELRIGSAGGDPNYQFGQISGIEVASDGSVLVLDNQARVIRVYDAQGQYVRDIGRPGSGPGELGQALTAIMLTAGDTVLVSDMMQQRVNRYAPDGTSIGDFRLAMEDGLAMRWEQLPDRTIVQQSRRMALPGQQQTQAMDGRDHLLVRASDGTVTDTLLSFTSGETFDFSGQQPQIRIFETEPMWAIGTDGTVYFGRNSDFSIEMRDSDGTVRRIARLPFERKPVTDEDQRIFRDLMRQLFEQQFEATGMPPAQAQQALDMVTQMVQFGEFYPAYGNLIGGPANTLWVQRVLTAAEAEARGETFDPNQQGGPVSPMWDVFDEEGRYLGVVELPARFMPMHVESDHIWGVLRDDLDVQHVVKLRVSGLTAAT